MKNYKSNYPYYDELDIRTTREVVDYAAEHYKDNVAYVYKYSKEPTRITYTDHRNNIYSLGTALISEGAKKGTHVAIFAENSYDWLNVYYTVNGSESVLVPIDRELPMSGLEYILAHSEAEYLFTDESHLKKILEVKDKLPSLKKIYLITQKEDTGYVTIGDLRRKGEELIKGGDDSYSTIELDPEEVTSILYTSGTTGASKGVMLSQKNICSDFIYALKSMHIHESCFSVLPYHHAYESTMQSCFLLHGRTVYINESLRMFLINLKLYKPYDMLIVPLFAESIYKQIWSKAEDSGKDKSLRALIKLSNALRKVGIDARRKLFRSVYANLGGNLCRFICGGAALKPFIAKFFDDIGIEVLTGYGITECSPLVSVNRDYFHDTVSVGVGIECCTVKVNEPDENGEGEIYVKGPNIMIGYYKRPEETAAAFDGEWFKTGDIGRIDEFGRIYITGRKKNIIVLKNGKNVYPEEIEGYYEKSENIAEIIVSAGRDGDDADSYIVAEIFASPERVKERGREAVELDIRAEIDSVNDTLPIYKRIKSVKFRDTEFEKTTTKKIKRKYN